MLCLINQIGQTGTIVHAGTLLTTSEQYRAILSTVKWITFAFVISSAIEANAVIARHISLALVYVVLAVFTLETGITLASIATNAIDALTFDAWIALTFVYVGFTILSCYTRYAYTFVAEKIEKKLYSTLKIFS